MFALAISRESPTVLLTSPTGWASNQGEKSLVSLETFPKQTNQLRKSVIENSATRVYRTYIPNVGNRALELISPAFKPASYMAVIVTGSSKSKNGDVFAVIECLTNRQTIQVFNGSSNINLVEALVTTPRNWCPGLAQLKLTSASDDHFVGVGSVFEISKRSYYKSSFAGRLSYLVAALLLFSFLIYSGALIASKKNWLDSSFAAGILFFGICCLITFYLASFARTQEIRDSYFWTIAGGVFALCFLIVASSDRRSHVNAFNAIVDYLETWILGALVLFAFSSLTYNGLGHWEPNFRFWPASWSSDNELPWYFADGIRKGWNLVSLFGGSWLPTDRPPLMVGAHLLVADVFELMQSNNDGTYLRGQAFNASAIALNTLWMPCALWVLRQLPIPRVNKLYVLVFVATIPFIAFNSIYGWPKAFGASFALLAFAIAWKAPNAQSFASQSMSITLVFLLGSLSMLAHTSIALFLLPMGLVLLRWNLWSQKTTVLTAFVASLLILLSWNYYKSLVLSVGEPVTAYALTGDYAFDRRGDSIWMLLKERYDTLSAIDWVRIKVAMFKQVFIPIDNGIAPLGLNNEYGSEGIDRLRAWDFLLATKGNVTLILAPLAAVFVLLRKLRLGAGTDLKAIQPYLMLMAISALSWVLVVMLFLAPAILHVLPQAAIFGLALGGAVICQAAAPRFFSFLFGLSLVYFVCVWVISPLHKGLTIDYSASVALCLLLAWCSYRASRYYGPYKTLEKKSQLTTHKFFVEQSEEVAAQSKSRFSKHPAWTVLLVLIVLGVFSFLTHQAVTYRNAPLIDVHAFRQTQTALTAYWIAKEGWTLAYQTPFAGYPWAVPLEFPFYQALVAYTSSVFSTPLDSTGRIFSYLVLLACAWPAFALTRRFKLPWTVPLVFCALLWSSPLYAYWGRTFMIETTALFLTLAALPAAHDLIKQKLTWKTIILYVGFSTAACLQKATTAGPVILFLLFYAVIYYWSAMRKGEARWSHIFTSIGLIALPILIGLGWTQYTDFVKMENPFGRQLTSGVLRSWNFGTIEQRLSFNTWRTIIWERTIQENAAGLFGVILLIAPLFFGQKYNRHKVMVLSLLFAYSLHIGIFTNLHFVHNYYQVATTVFVIAALSIVVGAFATHVTKCIAIAPILTLALVVFNITEYSKGYGVVTSRPVSAQDESSVSTYRLALNLNQNTPSGSGLVVFGKGYSSEVAFHSQRKTMTVPSGFPEYQNLWDSPQKFLNDVPLAAVVVCRTTPITKRDTEEEEDKQKQLERLKLRNPLWTLQSFEGCDIVSTGLPMNQSK
jgi:hypothetical protein